MAINKQTLKTRALTSLIFVLVMFAGLFISFWSFTALMALILGGACIEYYRIIRKIPGVSFFVYLLTAGPYIVLPVLLLIDLGFHNTISETGAGDFAQHFTALLPCAIIFSLWVNDTMAYLVGSVFGKTSLTAISPKKTWEGTIGGAVLCVLSMSLLGPAITGNTILKWHDWVVIAGICAVFGTFGDLLESKLKRMAGVKDSGNIMPGHGGFLDRFDSLFITVPFVWLYIKLFVK